VANSRFAAVALEAEEKRPPPRDDRGPPPVANSRFAAAAKMAEAESTEREERRRERDSFYGRDGDRRGDRDGYESRPLPQNSRFAAAVEADEDYVDREERMQRVEAGRHDDRHGGGRYDDRGGRFDDNRNSGFEGRGGHDRDDFEQRRPSPPKSRVDDLLKPKAALPTDNILKIPEKALSKKHEDNMLAFPPKKKQEERAPVEEEPVSQAVDEEDAKVSLAPLPSVNSDEVLAEFISGKKLGQDLKQWVEENRVGLPPVEKLVYEMLQEREKLNPDVDCGWADPAKYGAALLSLVEDDILAQMQVLWGVQFYCEKLGFPKLNDESVVQSMFRSMYKYDLAGDEAFAEWKEDESDEHAKGKLNAVIQTVDWFNWLEEDDEEEEDEENEE